MLDRLKKLVLNDNITTAPLITDAPIIIPSEQSVINRSASETEEEESKLIARVNNAIDVASSIDFDRSPPFETDVINSEKDEAE